MTLIRFKKFLKISSIIALFGIYTIGLLLLGKYSDLKKIPNLNKIKGQSSIDSPIESSVPFESIQSGSVISSYVKLCSNTLYGFEFSYPKDWFTTYNLEEEKCAYFAPYSFVIPTKEDNFFVPIKVETVKPDDWVSTLKFSENPNDFQNVISVENTQIGGRAVRKIKSLSTGQGQIPKNYAKLSFLIFDSKIPIVISYQQLQEGDDVQSIEKDLESMVASLRLF